MSSRTFDFSIGEYYHIYSRGVEKRKIFLDGNDSKRFTSLLYVANSEKSIHLSDHKNKTLPEIKRGVPLVAVGAWCLMPNHFHLLLKEIREGGIAIFMQRIFTAFTMYFNKKYERTGALFAGPFKSRHVADDRYIKKLISYLHLNAAELFDPHWKDGRGNIEIIEKRLIEYPYSSLSDFLGHERPERKILGNSIFELFDTIPTLKEIVDEANSYYIEHPESDSKARP